MHSKYDENLKSFIFEFKKEEKKDKGGIKKFIKRIMPCIFNKD
jgi:hypothetical protein